MNIRNIVGFVLLTFLLEILFVPASAAGELYVGSATTSITPSGPVPLSGQLHTRIARDVQSPVTATAVALETREDGSSTEQSILVSCDLVAIRDDANVQKRVRKRVQSDVPEIKTEHIVLSATHTHTAPLTVEGRYHLPDDEEIMKPNAYAEFLVNKLAGLVVKAWEHREKSGVSWGLGHAVVGRNRRATYRNGSAEMYGDTSNKSFRGLEGAENHLVDTLFFWTPERKLTATAINVACPAQEVEQRSAINADFWHPVRETLRRNINENLNVLGWIGAAGDQSPHLMYYEEAEERMRKLRGLNRLEELARRIHRAFEEARAGAEKDIRFDVPFKHVVRNIELPMRVVTDEEVTRSKSIVNRIKQKKERDPSDAVLRSWHQQVVDRYRQQQETDERPTYTMELHVIRLGDVAICTNPFELYTTYGNQIKARSSATQTFVIQLATASGGYLPTEKAVRGGGYSAEIMSTPVGPEGGDVLVDETVKTINKLWDEEN